MKLFIANLNFQVTVAELRQMFQVFGDLTECTLIIDKTTGKSKGYGFLSFAHKDYAQWAINAMNGLDINGRTLVVRKAKIEPQQKNDKLRRPRLGHHSEHQMAPSYHGL